MGWIKKHRAWERKISKLTVEELEALIEKESSRFIRSLLKDKIRIRKEGRQLH